MKPPSLFRRKAAQVDAVTKVEDYRVLIIGSCVTRDVFRTFGDGVAISDYFARTSVPSLVSRPFPHDDAQIHLESAFQRKNVIRDMDKSLWTRLEMKDFDLVLLDLIDERFDLLRASGAMITKSNELVASGFIESNRSRLEEISKSEYMNDAWRSDCQAFITRLEGTVEPSRVVMVKAFWATHYMTMEGQKKPFDETIKFPQEYISRSNDQLRKYYRTMLKCMASSNFVDLDPPLASEAHIWGLSPFHYTNEWYQACRQTIDQFASKVVGHPID